ncbi:MAG: PAS domain S-box protein, partial [Candidatus Kariarchaeaceae archaeon]
MMEEKNVSNDLQSGDEELLNRYKLFVDASYEGIALIDDNIIIHSNEKFVDMFGYEKSDIIGSPVSRFITPSDLKDMENEIISHYEKPYKAVCIRKDESTFPVDAWGTEILHQGKYMQITTIRDITDKKFIETRLEESESRYQILLDSAPIGIVVTRVSEILYANPRFIEMYGYEDKNEIIGSNMSKLHPPELVDIQTKRGSHRVRGGVEPQSYDSYGMKKNKSLFPIHIEVTRIQLTDGPANLAFVHDITEKRNAEEERAKINTQLQETRKLGSIGILAEGIAHDFNNILMSILGSANIALSQVSEDSPIKELLQMIENSSLQAAKLSKQMLTYSGRGKFNKETCNLSALIRELIDLIKSTLNQSLTIKYHLIDDFLTSEIDENLIKQVILNLVLNAAESIGENQGEISITTGFTELKPENTVDLILGEDLAPGNYNY